jgi:hypothetical protein
LLSNEADPCFLQLLEVGEEEYALLRADQGIRVDFANFPGKLIGLLDRAVACKTEDLPRWVLIAGKALLDAFSRLSLAWALGQRQEASTRCFAWQEVAQHCAC